MVDLHQQLRTSTERTTAMAGESPIHPEPRETAVAISDVNPAASEMTTRLAPTRPAPARPVPAEPEFHISEFAADVAGAMSPFGDHLEFPVPYQSLGYRHP